MKPRVFLSFAQEVPEGGGTCDIWSYEPTAEQSGGLWGDALPPRSPQWGSGCWLTEYHATGIFPTLLKYHIAWLKKIKIVWTLIEVSFMKRFMCMPQSHTKWDFSGCALMWPSWRPCGVQLTAAEDTVHAHSPGHNHPSLFLLFSPLFCLGSLLGLFHLMSHSFLRHPVLPKE